MTNVLYGWAVLMRIALYMMILITSMQLDLPEAKISENTTL